MRLLRPDDDAARTVFDVWKAPLIVYPGPFMHGSSGPTVIVRFPLGSVKWKNIRGITAGGVRVLRMEGG